MNPWKTTHLDTDAPITFMEFFKGRWKYSIALAYHEMNEHVSMIFEISTPDPFLTIQRTCYTQSQWQSINALKTYLQLVDIHVCSDQWQAVITTGAGAHYWCVPPAFPFYSISILVRFYFSKQNGMFDIFYRNNVAIYLYTCIYI